MINDKVSWVCSKLMLTTLTQTHILVPAILVFHPFHWRGGGRCRPGQRWRQVEEEQRAWKRKRSGHRSWRWKQGKVKLDFSLEERVPTELPTSSEQNQENCGQIMKTVMLIQNVCLSNTCVTLKMHSLIQGLLMFLTREVVGDWGAVRLRDASLVLCCDNMGDLWWY